VADEDSGFTGSSNWFTKVYSFSEASIAQTYLKEMESTLCLMCIMFRKKHIKKAFTVINRL
jgi:hypothetical protein